MANVVRKVPAGAQVLYNGSPTNPGGMARQATPGTVRPLTPGRNVLEFLRQQYPGQVITESQLRIEQVLNNSNNSYLFNPLVNQGLDLPTEVKLDKNDIFGIESIGFYLTQRTTANPGNEILQTFPNNSLLDSTNVTVNDLYTVYNGNFQLTIGTTLIYPNLPMRQFLYIPQTQKDSVNAAIPATSAWTSPTTGVGTYGPFANQLDPMFGQMRMHNILQLSGAAQNILQVNIPAFSGMKIATVTSGIANCLVFLAYGYIIKNAAYRGQAIN